MKCGGAANLAGLAWVRHLPIRAKSLHPTDASRVRFDPSEVRLRLGWEPRDNFAEPGRMMLESGLRADGLPGAAEALRS
jgi:GDP-D-mannose dehydratase